MSELNQSDLVTDKLTLLGQKQTAIKFKTFCKEDNVESVLVQELSPIINTVEAADGKVSYSGKLAAKSLVFEQNGSVGGMNYTADFSDEFFSAAINENVIVLPRCDILDFSTEADGAEVSVDAVVVTEFFVGSRTQYPLADGEGLVCKKGEIRVGTVSAAIDEVFSVNAELEIKADVARVLSSQSFAVVESAEIKDKILTVTGVCVLNVSYVTADTVLPKNSYFTYDFSQEIETETDGVPLVFASVRTTKIHLEVEEGANETAFAAESLVALRGIVVSEEEKEIVCDCFSPTNETVVSTAVADGTSIKRVCVVEQTVEEKTITSIPADAVSGGFFGGGVSIVNSFAVDGGIDIGGVISGNVVYSVDDKIKSERVDVPFKTVLACADAKVGDTVFIDAVIRNAEVSVEGGEATLKADIEFSVGLLGVYSVSFVSSVETGDVENTEVGAIEVSLAFKGDSLWDVAKNLKMSVEDVVSLNPELTDPLDKDQKLLIYHSVKS